MVSATTQANDSRMAEIVSLGLDAGGVASATALADAISRIGVATARLITDVDAAPATLSSDGVFFIAVSFGSPVGHALHRLANDLARTNRKIGGAVIFGVPARDFEWAASNPPGTPGLD